jgi:hypothetical protein
MTGNPGGPIKLAENRAKRSHAHGRRQHGTRPAPSLTDLGTDEELRRDQVAEAAGSTDSTSAGTCWRHRLGVVAGVMDAAQKHSQTGTRQHKREFARSSS